MPRVKSTPSAWDNLEEAPRAGLPDERTIARRWRWNRRMLWLAFICFPFMALATAVAVTDYLTADPPPATDGVQPATRADALLAVRTWLDSDPSPLPGASVVTWDSFEVVEPPAGLRSDANDNLRRELHTVILRTATGAKMTAQTLIVVDEAGRVTSLSQPSLGSTLPRVDESAAAGLWLGVTQVGLEAPAQLAVETWAQALTSGESLALRQAVGDPDVSHVYMPLAGPTDLKVEVTESGVAPHAGEDASDVIAAVTISYAWAGQDLDDASSRPVIAYDVLITEATSGAPRVVAWGAPGSGPTLTAYENAITGLGETTEDPVDDDQMLDTEQEG